jgi:hypothetical protein
LRGGKRFLGGFREKGVEFYDDFRSRINHRGFFSVHRLLTAGGKIAGTRETGRMMGRNFFRALRPGKTKYS